MKLRNGFVSNSSTSSFIIVGKHFSNVDKLEKAICTEKLSEIRRKIAEENLENPEYVTTLEDWLEEDELIHRYNDYEGVIFGACLGSIDCLDKIATRKKVDRVFNLAEKTFVEFFGEDNKHEVSLWGIITSC